MNRKKLQKTTIRFYAATVLLFLIFFLYTGVFENVSIQFTRTPRTCYTVSDYTEEELHDSSAPAGIRKKYRWILKVDETNDTALAFYFVHHYAEVYFDDELVYRLTPKSTNIFKKNISSNWVIIPIYKEDNGKEVRVVATPAFKNVINRKMEFQIGSLYDLYHTQLEKDMPQLFLSACCLVLGFFIMIIQLFLILQKRLQNWNVFYLGNFTVFLGLWKISDTRFSPFLFNGNPLLLGYLTIGALFLSFIPLTLYLANLFDPPHDSHMLMVSLVSSVCAIFVLACQVFNIAAFKPTLLLGHLLILIVTLLFLYFGFRQKKSKTNFRARKNFHLFLLLIFGVILDLTSYYIKGSSSGLVFSLLTFLIYTLLLFVNNLLDINRKAYTDIHTGLFNRSRWNNLLNTNISVTSPICMMMFDLNRLKAVNDTLGHSAGDKMILNFSNILRNVIPPTNTICRWGGDEFTVLITDAKEDIICQYLENISKAVCAYNDSGEKPEIYYAVGYVLSTEFPTLSPKELFQKADERMYQNKKECYQNQLK